MKTIISAYRSVIPLLFIITLLTPAHKVNSNPIEETPQNNENKTSAKTKIIPSIIPPKIQNTFANWKQPFANDLTEIPYFWHIPKVAGETMCV